MTCCAEKREIFFGEGGWLFAAGESWDGEEGEIGGRGSTEWGYINFC